MAVKRMLDGGGWKQEGRYGEMFLDGLKVWIGECGDVKLIGKAEMY